ncbi:TauD/TfdA family dioxygenase [Paenibacillus marchantiae]|uniref:TauD/TfdA family dioxygenase n=1 Tax=Paenibacillus marchantiae TaxID=3026433 RepID=UPI00237A16B2|nr:TauD/TfdA family dioxygenase [Paenibacillus marchantiae]WDQ32175.1 TauD/TfdA family dioxygenase [Paenibacillus marchantiae]
MKKTWAERAKNVRPQSISVSSENLVEVKELFEDQTLPLLITPKVAGLNLIEWSKNNKEFLEEKLLKYGGILYRGFNIKSQVEFDSYVDNNCNQLLHYKEGATPRTKLSDKVYTSTEFPKEHFIALHNELSYVTTWPRKIWFCSVIPAESGGATTIADVRKVYNSISPDIREKFHAKGWLLERNYGDGFGLTWQDVFHTNDKKEVETYCNANDMTFEWKDGDRLRTRQVRPAVVRHPITDELIWFNHMAFWHDSSLDSDTRRLFTENFGEFGFPYKTYYGDGTVVEDWEVENVRRAYDDNTVAFPWEKGDVMALDNMLVAHGRESFTGERKVLVAMGEPCSHKNLEKRGEV